MRTIIASTFLLLTQCGPALDYILTGDPNVTDKQKQTKEQKDYGDCIYPQPTQFNDTYKTDPANNSCVKDLPIYEQEKVFGLAGMFALNLPKAAQGGVKLLELRKELLNVSKAFGSSHEEFNNLPTFDVSALLQPPKLPDSISYVGDGVYRLETSADPADTVNPVRLIIEINFLYGDNYGINKKGDKIKHDLFALDNYIKTGLATGVFPHFKISFVQTGPLFPLLGLGETVPSPLEIDGKNLKDLTKEFQKLDAQVFTRLVLNNDNKCWRLAASFVSSVRLFTSGDQPFSYKLQTPTVTGYQERYNQTAEALESTLEFFENGGGSLKGGVSLKFVGVKMSFLSKTNFSDNLSPETLLSCN